MKKRKNHIKQKKEPVKISKKSKLVLGLIVAVVGFLIYANTLNHDYVLDDYSVIKENWVVKQGSEGIPTIFRTSYRYGYLNAQGEVYRPFSLFMFAVEWQLSEDNPYLGHFINVLFYALSGLLLFYTLSKLLVKYNIILPFIISLLFIAHPIHTEVVANIKSRDEIMSFFFVLISFNLIWTYLKNKKILYIILAIIFYFLALISKEGVITILAVFPLIIYFFSNVSIKRNMAISLLLTIPAIIYLLIRKKIIGQIDNVDVEIVTNSLVAARSFQEHFATAIQILGKYMFKMIYPNPLVADYSYNQIPIVDFYSIPAIFSLLIHITLFAYAILNFKKKHILSFGILFYFITISIYGNLHPKIMIGTSFGERLMYLTSLGYVFILGYVIYAVFYKKNNAVKTSEIFKQNSVIMIVTIIFLVPFSFKTYDRNKDWKNNFSLYGADVQKSPNSARMRYYYGLSLMKDKSLTAKTEQERIRYLDLSINEFKEAVKIYPYYADAYEQLGLSHFRRGLNNDAQKYYNQAIEFNPNKSTTYNNMGIIHFQKGDYEKSLKLYLRAVELNPRYSDAYYNLGCVYGTIQQFEKSVENFKISLKYNPSNASCYYFLGLTYQNMGDEANARNSFAKAYQLNPDLKK